MNTTNFDSSFCGSLPIHHINTVQAHGAIMLIAKSNHEIIQVSDNIENFLGIEAKSLVRTPLAKYTTDGASLDLNTLLQPTASGQMAHPLVLNGAQLRVLAHDHEAYYILEIEAGNFSEQDTVNGLHQVRDLMQAVESADSIQAICDMAIAEMQRITGFDGIMMYRFDADWNGTVISEKKTNGLESYLGVTFPASDVPKQARQLYLKNRYRLIPDRNYQPSKLYPVINPITNAFTDLSACDLRGVADVHLEYLKNMGVTASMSLRVIHNGQLWGLISCNHTQKKLMDFGQCAAIAVLSDVISTKISSIINKEEYDFVSKLQADRNSILDNIYNTADVKEGLFKGDVNVLDLFKASGAVLFTNGTKVIEGDVPNGPALDNLLLWLQAKNISQVYATHNLVKAFDEAIDYSDKASGILVIPFGAGHLNYLVFFRPEVVKTIEWGGNPHEAINFDPNGVTYHPRNSFKIWMETVNQTSVPWHQQEIQIAETLRSFLIEYQSKR